MNKKYGILMPVFSLPGGHGIGDFGNDAYSFASMLAASGCSYWQILPLNTGNPENGDSPYFSVSAYALNPLLISLEMLSDDGLITETELSMIPALSPDTINYAEVRAAKMALLETAALRFSPTPEFQKTYESNKQWIDNYALFDVIRSVQKKPWPQWDMELRNRDQKALAEFSSQYLKEIHIREVLQFFALYQWQKLRLHCADLQIQIIGDMPIYVALDSVDTWMNPELFKLNQDGQPQAVSGVPPDFFSETGQLWNNPVYNWDTHANSGFTWWIQRIRHLFTLYDIVRIDHFRGLVQYWEIPANESTAINGTWKDVPTYEFFDTLIREIHPFPVICEDLGTITDDVRAAMQHYGFPGMKVLQFAFSEDNPDNPYLPENYDSNCLVYTGTHDNLPTLGWLNIIAGQRELERIAQHTGYPKCDKKEIVWSLIHLAMKSRADKAIFPLQDILTLNESARINDPSKVYDNWQWRWNNEKYPATSGLNRLKSVANQIQES
jgi:4-alpha-glucanotransferase